MVYRSTLLVALVLTLTAWSYRSVARAGFVYEDHNGAPGTIYAPWSGWATEWASFRSVQLGRFSFLPTPRILTNATYRLNAWAAPTAAGFHLVNVGIHMLNVVLLSLLVWPVLKDWGALAIGVFALHPLQVESVAGIAYRGELLATTFVFLALLATWRIRGERLAFVAAVLCGCLALLAKETTASGLVFAWLFLAPEGRRLWPFAAWMAALGAAGLMIATSPGMLSGWPYVRHFVLQLVGFWVLLLRVVFPVGQTIDLDLLHVSARVLAVPVVALWLLLLSYISLASTRWGVWTGWALGMTIACLVVRLLSPSPELLHEHAMYLPLAAFGVAAAAIVNRTPYPY